MTECDPPVRDEPVDQQLEILLVEDVELNITVATAVLEKMGHRVTVARDGAEALQQAADHSFELILLDIQLPDMSGFEVAAHLRDRYGEDTPPLVALTANSVRDQSEYHEQGMDAALSKPLSSKRLKAVLGELFLMHEAPVETRHHEPEQGCLDLEFLNDYAETVGKELLLSSVELFEQAMPAYMAVLESNLMAKHQDGIVSEGHKIKGALGSIGLKRMRDLAQQIQSPDLPAWWENVPDWVDKLKHEYPKDLAQLRQWLEQ